MVKTKGKNNQIRGSITFIIIIGLIIFLSAFLYLKYSPLANNHQGSSYFKVFKDGYEIKTDIIPSNCEEKCSNSYSFSEFEICLKQNKCERFDDSLSLSYLDVPLLKVKCNCIRGGFEKGSYWCYEQGAFDGEKFIGKDEEYCVPIDTKESRECLRYKCWDYEVEVIK